MKSTAAMSTARLHIKLNQLFPFFKACEAAFDPPWRGSSGRHIKIFWSPDQLWYYAEVVRYDLHLGCIPSNIKGMHQVSSMFRIKYTKVKLVNLPN